MDYCDTPEHELEVTGQQLDGNVFDEPQEVEFIITIIINVLYCKICIVRLRFVYILLMQCI